MEDVFTDKDKDAAYKTFAGQRAELSTVTLDKDGEVREMLADVLDLVAERKVSKDLDRFWETFMLVVKPDPELRQKLFHLHQLLKKPSQIYPDLKESERPIPFAWVMTSFEEQLLDFDRDEAGTIEDNLKYYLGINPYKDPNLLPGEGTPTSSECRETSEYLQRMRDEDRERDEDQKRRKVTFVETKTQEAHASSP